MVALGRGNHLAVDPVAVVVGDYIAVAVHILQAPVIGIPRLAIVTEVAAAAFPAVTTMDMAALSQLELQLRQPLIVTPEAFVDILVDNLAFPKEFDFR